MNKLVTSSVCRPFRPLCPHGIDLFLQTPFYDKYAISIDT